MRLNLDAGSVKSGLVSYNKKMNLLRFLWPQLPYITGIKYHTGAIVARKNFRNSLGQLIWRKAENPQYCPFFLEKRKFTVLSKAICFRIRRGQSPLFDPIPIPP